MHFPQQKHGKKYRRKEAAAVVPVQEIRVGNKANRIEWKRSHQKNLHPRDKKLARSHKTKLVSTKVGFAKNLASPSGNLGLRARVGCFCGQQLGDAQMVLCDKCGDSAHIECVKATVSGGRWRCAQCNKPNISHRKRVLDDGARGMSVHSHNAEEARAAKKRSRKEKEVETRVLAKKLADQGLCTVEIPADGHCLFSALSDQLKRTGCPIEHSYKSLRRAAAGYMMNNEQHFKGFLSLEGTSFESYCRRIERTNAWGGQHELIALSHFLKRNIQVMRHDMSIQMFPDPDTHPSYAGEPLRLSYHIHEYSGEHYNSVVSLEEKTRRSRATRVGRAEEASAESAALLQASSSCAESIAPVTAVGSSSSPAAVAAPKQENPEKCAKPPLTDAERLKKSGVRGRKKGAHKVAGHKKSSRIVKQPVPWVQGVGGDKWRVVVWDTRQVRPRLIMGNSCPTAKNICRYLEEKPYMKVWKGGVGDEPRAPIRSHELKPSEGGLPHGVGSVSESKDTAEQEGRACADHSSSCLDAMSDPAITAGGKRDSGRHSESIASQIEVDVHGVDANGSENVHDAAAATTDMALHSVSKLYGTAAEARVKSGEECEQASERDTSASASIVADANLEGVGGGGEKSVRHEHCNGDMAHGNLEERTQDRANADGIAAKTSADTATSSADADSVGGVEVPKKGVLVKMTDALSI